MLSRIFQKFVFRRFVVVMSITIILLLVISYGYINSNIFLGAGNKKSYNISHIDNIVFDKYGEYLFSYDFNLDGQDDLVFKYSQNLVVYETKESGFELVLNISFPSLTGVNNSLLKGAIPVNDSIGHMGLVIYGSITGFEANAVEMFLYDYREEVVVWNNTFKKANSSQSILITDTNMKLVSIDLDKDGAQELVFVYDKIYVLNPDDGEVKWVCDISHYDFGWMEIYFGNLDGDGVDDLLSYLPMEDIMIAISGINGTIIWQVDMGEYSERYGLSITSIYLMDVNEDGIDDIIFTSKGDLLAAITCAGGILTELWSIDTPSNTEITGLISIENQKYLLLSLETIPALFDPYNASYKWKTTVRIWPQKS